MQREAEKVTNPCLECSGLKDGTRPNQDSHEYLIATRLGSANSSASYRCLICSSVLTREQGEFGTRWQRLDVTCAEMKRASECWPSSVWRARSDSNARPLGS